MANPNPSPSTRFVKGQSGNPAGRLPGKTHMEHVEGYLDEIIDKKTGKTRRQQQAEEWVDNALTAPALFLAMMDRLYGKVPSALDVTTKGESMNADVNKQEAEHRLAALLDKLSKRVDE